MRTRTAHLYFSRQSGRTLSGFRRANFLRIRSQPDWSSYFQPVLSLATASWSPFWKVVFLHRWLCGKGWEFKCLAGPDKFMIYLMNVIVEQYCTLSELALLNIANLCRLCKNNNVLWPKLLSKFSGPISVEHVQDCVWQGQSTARDPWLLYDYGAGSEQYYCFELIICITLQLLMIPP